MGDDKLDDKLIEGHQYDGIQELDNPLPRWWLVTFYATMVFAVFYYGYYEVFGGPSSEQELAMAMAVINETQEKTAEQKPSASGINIESLIADKAQMKIGADHYQGKCAACHSPQGQGLIGPNLTDKYWLHSKGDAEGILNAINSGFPDKGMPPWGHIIPEKDHPALVAYVISLQGTEPPNPKAPQGDLVE